jgi:nitrile hydratase subunit beta
MNGVHDLGGMHGMGPVVREANEPVFHEEWERRAFALTLASAFVARWNLDATRHARELMPPRDYLASGYYEHWLHGLERQLAERGLVTRAELEARVAGMRGDGAPGREQRVVSDVAGHKPPATGSRVSPPGRVLVSADVEKVLRKGSTARMADRLPPRFLVGDPVVARNVHPVGHTRLPRYVRGKRGFVDRDHGVFIFPDAHAMRGENRPQHCYSVRFTARELWGPDASERETIHIDLFDEYLDPA